MSLLVWLPLTKDIKNYGLSDIEFKTNGAVFTPDEGKVGQCYYLNGKTISCSDFNLLEEATEFSACCWVKFTTFPSGSNAYCISLNTSSSTDRKFILGIYSSNGTTASFRINGGNSTGTLELNKWYHLAICVSNTTGYLYINGLLVKTVTGVTMTNTAKNLVIGGRSTNTAGTTFNGVTAPAYYNDIRVYDYCLSPKEIKEISKGLIAHYPLRDRYAENTKNILLYPTPGNAYTPAWDAALHPNAIQVSNWSAGYNSGVSTPATGYHGYWQLIDNIPTMVFPDLNTQFSKGHRWLGISSTASTSNNLTSLIGAGTTYTISFEARGSVPGMAVQTGLYYKLTSTTGKGFQDGQEKFILTTDWKRYSVTKTLSSSADASSPGQLYIYGHYNSIEGTSFVRNVQIEVKDHATPYVNNIRDAGVVQDCSGNGYDLSFSNEVLPFVNNSSRNDYCVKISDGVTNYLQNSSVYFPYDEVTMSCWFKTSAGQAGGNNYHIPFSSASGHYEISIEGTSGKLRGGFYVNNTRYCSTTSGNNICDGLWHMLTLTYDGATIRRYLDGIEVSGSSTAVTGTLSGGLKLLTLGHYGTSGGYGNKNSYMSDVRLYATALSAEDILSLYKTSAIIDNQQNIFAYNFVEEDASKINKNGTIDSLSFTNGQELHDMKIKILDDGSCWARLFWHDVTTEKVWFTNHAESDLCLDKNNRYSRMGIAEKFINADGEYEFMLTYPKLSTTLYNRWKQTSSPNASTAAGFTPITTAWSQHFGGLRKTSGTATYNCDNIGSTTWYAAIGQQSTWTATQYIPGANGSSQTETELWVRIDTIPHKKLAQIFDNVITANNFIEL